MDDSKQVTGSIIKSICPPKAVEVKGNPDTSSSAPLEHQETPYVVGIGASAGGLQPIETFFRSISPDTGAVYVVVQHLSPDFKSLMKELLSRQTVLNVHRVEQDMSLQPNTIYLIPPRKNMIVENDHLRLIDQDLGQGRPPNFPIDLFLESLAAHYRERAVAVILSGTGSDGSRGVRAVSEAGGFVLVQSQDSAQFDGMPQNAIDTGLADYVLPPTELAEIVTNISKRKRLRLSEELLITQDQLHGHFAQIIDLLQSHHGIDFSHYKPSTLARRIERRMMLGGHRSIEDYYDHMDKTIGERKALCSDMLINVTHFFRDTLAWELLANAVIPRLVESVTPPDPIRVWVTACSTGEEAYTVAMLFHEAIQKSGKPLDLKIFATDIDKESLEVASTGLYPESTLNDINKERFARHFNKKGTSYQITRQLRETVIFAQHNLIKDAPFTKMDMVTCRNALIYMQPNLQQQVISMLHYALVCKGVLFLGASEAVGGLEGEFDVLDRKWRVFEKKRNVRLPLLNRRSRYTTAEVTKPPPVRLVPSVHTDAMIREAFGTFLSGRKACCMIINPDFELLHAYGQPDLFLKIPIGKTTPSIMNMVNRHMALPLNTALHRAKKNATTIAFSNIQVDAPSGEAADSRFLNLRVDYHKQSNVTSAFYAVIVEESDRTVVANVQGQFDPNSEATHRILQLEQELQEGRETLQATIEELETTNEEQQATNQELVAANEELQSTNEELHSVNEELYTVNHEYQNKVHELTNVNHDIENLLSSTDVGTVFLDKFLRIRKFTPPAKKAISLEDRDIGRKLDHFSHNLEYSGLIDDVRHVLSGGETVEREVRTKIDGDYLLMRVHPYHTDHEGLHGAVITFVDISDLKSAEQSLREVNRELQQKNQEMEDFAYTISHDLKSPLVTIGGMIGLIQDRLKDHHDPTVNECMRTATATVQEMRESIDDLLELSRVGRAKHEPRPVSLNKVIHTLLDRLNNEIEAKHAVVDVAQNLPTIQADAKRIEQLFDNLLVNAIKYACDQPRARIEIGNDSNDSHARIYVKDYGPGIAKQYHNKIFGLFQRLNADKDGSGVGLAIVKRIMDVHHGRIWVESDLGEGATFWLEFPQLP